MRILHNGCKLRRGGDHAPYWMVREKFIIMSVIPNCIIPVGITRISLLMGGFQKEVDRIDLADSVMIKRSVVIKRDERFRVLAAPMEVPICKIRLIYYTCTNKTLGLGNVFARILPKVEKMTHAFAICLTTEMWEVEDEKAA